ncbi:hypothetical protein ACEPP6_18375 [Bacillus rugosus]
MKISRILLTVMELSSILTFTHLVDEDSASNDGLKLPQIELMQKKEGD